MRWPQVVTALVAALEQDVDILAELGGAPHIYPSEDAHAGRVPSIAWTVITDAEEENVESVRVQWDCFTAAGQVHLLERAVRRRVTAEIPVQMGGIWMWMHFQSGRSHEAPAHRIAHRSFDVIYEPARED